MALTFSKLTSFQKLMGIGYTSAAIFNVASWVVLVVFLPHETPSTILHYNVFFGPDSFGEWYQALVVPAIGLVAMCANAYGAWYFWKRDRFLSYALTSAAVAVQLAVLVAAGLLIRINGTL